MFQVDKKFPGFNLKAYNPIKDEIVYVNSKIQKGKFLVLFFYPADFTFVCPTEIADMAARYEEFKKLGAEVVVVSIDSVYSHKGWVETEELLKGLKFLMASDKGAKLSKELGIYDEEGGVSQRAAFIIDENQILRAVDVTAGDIGRSAGEILRKVRALKFVATHKGKVCPASWDEGSATITPSIKIAGKVKRNLKK